MIFTSMSAKQLYFPHINRAQRGPFFGRNPLFVKGSCFEASETIGQNKFPRRQHKIRAFKKLLLQVAAGQALHAQLWSNISKNSRSN